MITRRASLGLLSLFVLLSGYDHVLAQQPDWLQALRSGGYVIVFRHGATNPDQFDHDPFNWSDPSNQRRLSDVGRAKAKAVGEAFRKLKIPVERTYASQINRSIESATLMFPDIAPTITADLTETGLFNTPIENGRRFAAIRKMASTLPPAGTNIVIVGHQPNIIFGFGKDWFDIAEGEASIFKPDGSNYKLIARVKDDEWAKFAP